MLALTKGRLLYGATLVALCAGIVWAFILFWGSPGSLPGARSGDVLPRPQPAPLYWVLGSDQQTSVARDGGLSISVLGGVISPLHITLFYSVESTGEVNGQRATIASLPSLLADDTSTYETKRVQTLVQEHNATLGSVSFSPYVSGGRTLTFSVPELQVDSGRVVPGKWSIPALKRNFPEQVPPGRMWNLKGRAASDLGTISANPGGAFGGSSPQGQVATVSFRVADALHYFLVGDEGLVEEISQADYRNILDFLGMAQSR